MPLKRKLKETVADGLNDTVFLDRDKAYGKHVHGL